MRRIRLLLLSALLACAAFVPARAHPHIWIDAVATLVFAESKLTGVRIQWTFDELFSSALRDQFDPNKTGKFDGQALANLKADATNGLKEFNWFTHLTIGGKKLVVAEGKDFSATIEGDRVVYRFTVPVVPSVNPAATPVTLSLYDQSFYIDVALAKENPVRIEGATPCKTAIVTDKGNPLYYGMFFPQRIDLVCK
ncbi:MAG: DUF1007 family protein [Alphaproteobacteria bacterium]|nr:DUF1007 family protein [Alphaproteobacteria bacterium]